MRYGTILQLQTLLTIFIFAALNASEAHRHFNKDLNFGYNQSTRIFGGYPAKEGDFPSFVGIAATNHSGDVEKYCGGVAVSEQLVLTAGHCNFGEHEKIIVAQTILHPYLWKSEGIKVYEVDKICDKPKYGIHTDQMPVFDYQLIRLRQKNTGIKFALVAGSRVPVGYRAITVGLGYLDEDSDGEPLDFPEKLQFLPVEKIGCGKHRHSARICFQSYMQVGHVCSGDSGDPVYGIRKDGKQVVIGLASFRTKPCHTSDHRVMGYANINHDRLVIQKIARSCLRY